MAKNWMPAEAVEAIRSNDKAAIRDIGGRFPLFLHFASQVNDAGLELLKGLNKYTTVRTMESAMKGDIQETEETEDEADEVEEVEEAPAPKARKSRKAKAKPVEVEAEEDEEEDEDEEVAPTKTAKELFNECKKAGIEVEPKKAASYYTAALAKHEAAQAEKVKKSRKKPAPKADDDDWDI